MPFFNVLPRHSGDQGITPRLVRHNVQAFQAGLREPGVPGSDYGHIYLSDKWAERSFW